MIQSPSNKQTVLDTLLAGGSLNDARIAVGLDFCEFDMWLSGDKTFYQEALDTMDRAEFLAKRSPQTDELDAEEDTSTLPNSLLNQNIDLDNPWTEQELVIAIDMGKSMVSTKWHARNQRSHSLSINDWNFAINWFDGKCAYCGIEPKSTMQKDHFIPVARGGYTVSDNIVPACFSCNSNKSANDPTWWVRRAFPEHADLILDRIYQFFDEVREVD